MASAGTPSAGTGGMSLGGVGGSAAGAPSSAGTGGAMCVARKACADAGTIVNNCVPCDQKHCGDIDDGCSGVIECGTCPGSSNACSTAHEC
jgi:hypothetical protein